MSTKRTMTEEELMALPRDGYKRELVDGEIRVSPAGTPHGHVILQLGARLVSHVNERPRLEHGRLDHADWNRPGPGAKRTRAG